MIGANQGISRGFDGGDEMTRTEAALSHIGPYLKKRRAALGLSLQEVADRAGVTKAHIWDIEQGNANNPTIKTALAICDALRCSLQDLLGYDTRHPMVSVEELEIIATVRRISKAA